MRSKDGTMFPGNITVRGKVEALKVLARDMHTYDRGAVLIIYTIAYLGPDSRESEIPKIENELKNMVTSTYWLLQGTTPSPENITTEIKEGQKR